MSDINSIIPLSRELFLKGKLSTVDLLVQTILDQLLLTKNIMYFVKTSYFKEEVNRILPLPLVFPATSVTLH